MKHVRFAVALLLALCANLAQAVGFQHLTLEDPRMEIGIWYPSKAPPIALPMGMVTATVAPNGAIDGDALPTIVISHGTGGYFLSYDDTAMALADAGYVVVALTHPGDNYADDSRSVFIMDRPRQISRALDYVLRDWSGHAHVDAARIGMFGFSAGGFTALVSIGGVPDLGRIGPFCREHAGDFVCQQLAKHPDVDRAAIKQSGLHDARIKAAAVAAPALGFTFSKVGLEDVTVPVALWRAEDDVVVPHPWYAEAVRRALPRPPEYHLVAKAGHYDFLAPCSAAMQARVPAICASAPGFERAAFHARFNAELVAFFGRSLRAPL